MLKKIFGLVLIFLSFNVIAQVNTSGETLYDIKFSDEHDYKSIGKQYASDICAVTEKYIYLVISDEVPVNSDIDEFSIQLVNRQTLQLIREVKILGTLRKEFKKKFLFADFRQRNNGFLLSLFVEKNGIKTYYHRNYNYDLKPTSDLLETFSMNPNQTQYKWMITDNQIATLSYEIESKTENIVLNYQTFDLDFKLKNHGSIETDFTPQFGKIMSKLSGVNLIRNFKLNQDGEFIGVFRVSRNKEDGSQGSFLNLYFISTEENTYRKHSFDLKENTHFLDYNTEILNNNTIAVTGFYTGEEADTIRGSFGRELVGTTYNTTPSGYFTYLLDIKTNKVVHFYQIPFEEKLLTELINAPTFIYDKKGKNDPVNSLFSVDVYDVEDHSDIPVGFLISDAIYNVNENTVILFGESLKNWKVSGEGMHYMYNSLRGRLFQLKISMQTGKLIWANSFPVNLHYDSSRNYTKSNSFNIYNKDLNPVSIMYYSYKIYDPNNSEIELDWVSSKYQTNFRLATFDLNTGKSELLLERESIEKTTSMERINLTKLENYKNFYYSLSFGKKRGSFRIGELVIN